MHHPLLAHIIPIWQFSSFYNDLDYFINIKRNLVSIPDSMQPPLCHWQWLGWLSCGGLVISVSTIKDRFSRNTVHCFSDSDHFLLWRRIMWPGDNPPLMRYNNQHENEHQWWWWWSHDSLHWLRLFTQVLSSFECVDL